MTTVNSLLAGAATVALIQCKAKKFGTFASPTNGEIKYVDPKHDDERYHSPQLTRAEADMAFERGLIEDPEDAKSVDAATEEESLDPKAIGTVAAARTEEFAKEDDEGGIGSGTLDSRQSTAWPDAERVAGGAHGFTDGIRTAPEIETDSGDDDAPPAPKRRKAPAADA